MDVLHILKKIEKESIGMVRPAGELIIERYGQNPFLVLVSCILSLRTKDAVSLSASIRLFKYAMTPQELLSIPVKKIEKLIYPVGFYRQKSAQLHELCQQLLDKHAGLVPNTKDELIALKGVGLKTTNLVLAQGFNIPALCVDIHVHRISNRLGLVNTKTPEQTEVALKKVIPQEYWIKYNSLLVMWGQNICLPLSPYCSRCPLKEVCPKKEVKKSR